MVLQQHSGLSVFKSPSKRTGVQHSKILSAQFSLPTLLIYFLPILGYLWHCGKSASYKGANQYTYCKLCPRPAKEGEGRRLQYQSSSAARASVTGCVSVTPAMMVFSQGSCLCWQAALGQRLLANQCCNIHVFFLAFCCGKDLSGSICWIEIVSHVFTL